MINIYLTSTIEYLRPISTASTVIQKLIHIQSKLYLDENFIDLKGKNLREQYIVLLKIALINPNEPIHPVDIVNDCLLHCGFIFHSLLHELLGSEITTYLTNEDRIQATKAFPTLFKMLWNVHHLLNAFYFGDEITAFEIVTKRPELMDCKAEFKTPENQCEQIFYATPLQLMLYTGDWKMWSKILPLIGKNASHALDELCQGGPDLIKISKNPRFLSIAELKRQGSDDLLHNPNGIFFFESDKMHLFYVEVCQKKQIKRIQELSIPEGLSSEDATELEKLKNDIRENIAIDSGLRSSNQQHALIQKIFGLTLERKGIDYVLNGVSYQDTYDGCVRLKNAYRKYLEIAIQHQNETILHNAWLQWVGMSQRYSMVHLIQRFCEKNQTYFPLPTSKQLENRKFIRSDEFDHWDHQVKHIYPLGYKKDLGFDFGLVKAGSRPHGGDLPRSTSLPLVSTVEKDLAAIRLIEDTRKKILFSYQAEDWSSLTKASNFF